MNLQSSLLILPPPDVQAFAAPIRKQYAPFSFAQGPAHLTLFYPFIGPEEIETAIGTLRVRCHAFDPFQITLDRYARFETTHLLVPSDPEPILSLHKHLFEAFPKYPPYEGNYGHELIPHLTLATFDTREDADKFQLPPRPSFEFMVSNLHLYMGPADEQVPWIPVAIIELGAG